MEESIIISLVISLVLTIIIEIIFAVFVGVREKWDLALLCLVNVLTNPFVVFIYNLTTYYHIWNTHLTVLVLEIATILVEAYYYRTYGRNFRHPLLFSFGANAFSYMTGIILSLL